jgi:hypothetical protein
VLYQEGFLPLAKCWANGPRALGSPLAPDACDSIPDRVVIHFEGGSLEVSVEPRSWAEVDPSVGNHGSDNSPVGLDGFAFNDPFHCSGRSKNQQARTPQTSIHTSLDQGLPHHSDLALPYSALGHEGCG